VQTVSVPDERALELIGWDVTVASPATTLAPTSTSSTTSSTTSSSTLSTSPTTTLPACVTPRCRLDDTLHDGTCQGATELVERATSQSGRKARRTLARARKLFQSARRVPHTASTASGHR
jgi:hypothetical protein